MKKSDLREHIRDGMRLLKPVFDPLDAARFILTMLFFSYAGVLRRRPMTNLHDDLIEAFAALEESSPLLKGVMLPAVSGVPIPEPILNDYLALVERFHATSGVFDVPERFSSAYEIWLDQLAQLSKKRGIAFYTPRSLARLLVELAKPAADTSIYDPTAGTGSLLIEAAQAVRRQGGDVQTLRLSGREKHPGIWAIAQMNMAVHGLWDAALEQGDTLETALMPGVHGVHDLVVQALPVGADGKTSRREEEAFLRHALTSLAPHGRAALLTPSYLMQHDHRDLWQMVINRDWLETVISLPPMLLQGTHAGAVVLMLNKQKPVPYRDHVLFIDATPENNTTPRHHHLRDEDIRQIVETVGAWKDVPGYARVVARDQIRTQGYSLNITRYMEWHENTVVLSIETALERYRAAVQDRAQALDRLFKALDALNYPVCDEDGTRGKSSQ